MVGSIMSDTPDSVLDPKPQPNPLPRPRPELTRWKKILMGGAGAFLVIGASLQLFGSSPESGGGGGVESATGQSAVGETATGETATGLASSGLAGPGALQSSSLVDDTSPKIDWPPQDPSDTSPKIDWPPKGQLPGDPSGGAPGGEPKSAPTVAPGAAGWSPFFLKGGFSFFVAFCVGYAARVWLKLAALALGTIFLGVFLLSYSGVIIGVDWARLEGWWDILAARIEAEAVDFKTFLTGSLPQAGLASLGLVAGFKRR
jgi:uncharacterized membrane protein (Fun14 family)